MNPNQNILPAHATPDVDPEAIRAATDQRVAGIAYRAKLTNGGEAGLNRTPGLREQINESALQQAAEEGYDVSHLVAPTEPTPPTAPQPDVSGTALTPQMKAAAAGINVPRDKEPIFQSAPRHASDKDKASWYRRSMRRILGAGAVAGFAAGGLLGVMSNFEGAEDVKRAAASITAPGADGLADHASHEKANERSIDYLFDNPNKETPNAFGPEGDMTSVKAALADLTDRYQKDPALVAAHAAANGFINYEDVDSYTAKFASNPEAWDTMVDRLGKRYDTMTFSIGAIPEGYTSSVWFADANKDGVPELRQSVANLDGSALIGADTEIHAPQIVYRIGCGFQPREESEINVPALPATAPEVTQTPSQPEAPASPETPNTPQTPETPQTPAEPETPGTPEDPETPGEPEEPETPEEEGNEEKPRGGAIDDDPDMNEGVESGDHRTESGELKPATQPTNPVYDPVAAEQKQKENAEKLKKPVESIQENPAAYEPAPVVNDGRSTVDMSDPTNIPGEQTDANGNVYTVDANGNVINNSEIQE